VVKNKQSETPWAVGGLIAYNPDATRDLAASVFIGTAFGLFE
jgi:hypothetical protein